MLLYHMSVNKLTLKGINKPNGEITRKGKIIWLTLSFYQLMVASLPSTLL